MTDRKGKKKAKVEKVMHEKQKSGIIPLKKGKQDALESNSSNRKR